MLVAVAAATTRYHLPLGAFDELIEGCENDVRGTSYATFDDLVVYCRLVAGSIGRLSLAVFGTTDPHAVELADDLGVALQLTNILRDVVEDRANGRVYLPAEDAIAVGCPPTSLAAMPRSPIWSPSNVRGPTSGSNAACSSSLCSIAGAGPVSEQWPASTTGCSSISSVIPTP